MIRRSTPAAPDCRCPTSGHATAPAARSSTTCALVPEKPNELTPTQPSGNGVSARRHRDPARRARSMCGFSRAEVQARRHRLMPQHQHRLDQPGDSRRRLGVADVGLHRADQQLPADAAGRTPRQRLHLDRIAQRRAGAVRFDVADLVRRHPGVGQGARGSPPPAPDRSAPSGRRCGRPGSPPCRGSPRGCGRRRLRLRQPLEHDHAAALAADEAVRRGVERLAASVRRQHMEASKVTGARTERQVHATGQRERHSPDRSACTPDAPPPAKTSTRCRRPVLGPFSPSV